MSSPLNKVPSPDKINATPPLGQESGKTPPDNSFKNLMKEGGGNPPPGLAGSQPPGTVASPFDLAGGHPLATGPTMQSLMDQTKHVQTVLGNISNSLGTQDLKLKQSQKYVLNNKLQSASGHLQSANMKLRGINPAESAEAPLAPQPKEAGPFTKFLSYVTDGQNQLEAAQGQLKALNESGQNVNPAQLLLVQLKLNKAQQELEYSSIMLSNAVSDIKTLFGIQL